MDSSTSPLFRKQALEYYTQSREKAILPRLAKPPAFLFLWLILTLAGISMIVTWFGRVPVYASGPGIVIEHTLLQKKTPVYQAMALVFIPVDPAHPLSLRAGMPVRLEIGTQGQPFTAVIDTVESGVLSPAEIQQHYALGSRISALVSGPAIVFSIKPGSIFASQVYAGSFIFAQVQIGSISVFSSLFGFAQPVGE
jgi:hypothetical protein